MTAGRRRRRNHLRQYDDLADLWWDSNGPFAALHWIAAARRDLVPPAPSGGGTLLDVACGGGLMAPHVPQGYEHVGIDLVASALHRASAVGVTPVLADAAALPFPDGTFDVVVAGEILEHVSVPEAVVAEIARVAADGGTVIIDTIADTVWARLSLVTVAERLPGGPPPRCHDPELFVGSDRLRRAFAAHGIELALHGLRPAPLAYLRYLATRRGSVPMLRTSSLSGLYAGVGTKEAPSTRIVGS